MKAIAVIVLLVCFAGFAAVSQADYQSAKRKFQAIDKKPPKPGTRISLTASELNAYVQTELPLVAPPGIRDPKVDLQGNNVATGRALIDFVKLRSGQGKSTNWMMRKLFDGEREVAVTTRVNSGGGQATVDLQSVEIGGIQIQGAALDFIINNYLIPNYPDAKIGKPFALHKHVEKIEVSSGVAYVTTR
jgi:hypothetical protein